VKSKIKTFLANRGLELSKEQLQKLQEYKNLLYKVSGRLNLLSAKDRERIEDLHFSDSLAAATMISKAASVADWGSGGGLPGIPLSIARPDIQMTLVESRTNKAGFLMRAKRELNLTNIRVFAGRGEDIQNTYDLITVRAVGKLSKLIPIILNKLSENGQILCYKGPGLEKELIEADGILKELQISFTEDKVTLPQGESRRYLLLQKTTV